MDARRLLTSITDSLTRASRRALGGARRAGERATQAAGLGRSGEAPPAVDFSAVDEDEALLLVRAMIAASVADGVLEDDERERLTEAMREAGIDPDERSFLATELSWPRDIEEIADEVATPEKAERVYAAARLVIEPETMQEREFLRLLAERMDLGADRVAAIEARAPGGR